MEKSIAIIGGGITGLTTALALSKVGITSQVFEQAEDINEVGAGIWLQPNAIKILDWLGLKEEISESGYTIKRMEICDKFLSPLTKINDETVQDAFGNKTIAIHRGRLQQILYKAASKVSSVLLGHRLTDISQNKEIVELNFNENVKNFDIVLAADGINSKVRNILFPDSKIRYTNQICWRGISNFVLPTELQEIGREAWGQGIRFGFSSISESNEVYWFAVARENGESLGKRELMNLFSTFAMEVPALIQDTNHIHEAKLADLVRLKQWAKGKVCLIGDAAHATTPNMGQGACQGIEDAFYISKMFSQEGLTEGVFPTFEKARRAKVDFIVNNSWRLGQAAHNRIGRSIMKLIMKTTPQKVMSSQMNKIFSIKDF